MSQSVLWTREKHDIFMYSETAFTFISLANAKLNILSKILTNLIVVYRCGDAAQSGFVARPSVCTSEFDRKIG